MALSTATITFNVEDMTGVKFDARRTKVWLTTNVPNDTIIDKGAEKIRLGSGNIQINPDGTGSATVWVPGPDANPRTWQTTFHVDYPDRNRREQRVQRHFGPFTITASGSLAKLDDEQAVPPTYITQVTQQLDAKVAQATTAANNAATTAATAAAAAVAAEVAGETAAAQAARVAAESAAARARDISDIDSTDDAVDVALKLPGGKARATLSASFASVISIKKHGADPSATPAANRTAIAAALTEAEELGSNVGVYIPADGTYLVSGAPLAIPSLVTVFGAGVGASIVKNANGATSGQHVFTNKNPETGDTGLGLRDLTIDANGGNATGAVSPVWMDNLAGCDFDRVEVIGGRNNGVIAGSGSGLHIQRMTRSRIGYVVARNCDYDGILLGGCTHNVIETVHGIECNRNALQLSRYPIGSGLVPSQFNTIGKVIAQHSTGEPRPGTTAPTTGAVYFHNSWENTCGEVVAEGVRMGVGGIGTDGMTCEGNVVNSAILRVRGGFKAAVDWETLCHRNVVENVVIRPLSGASGMWVRVGASSSFNRTRVLHASAGDGSGAWTVTYGTGTGSNDTEIAAAVGAPSISDAGSTNSVRYAIYGRPYLHRTGRDVITYGDKVPTWQTMFSGASGAVPSGWAPRWDQAGATWDEQAAGGLRIAKTGTSRSALAATAGGEFLNGEVLVKFRCSVAADGQTPFGVVVRGSGPAASENGYYLSFFFNAVRLSRYTAGAASLVRDAAFTLTPNAAHWMRLSVSGADDPVLRARIWADADAEPTAWTISTTDVAGSKIVTPGWFGVLASTVASAVVVERVAYFAADTSTR